MAVISPDLMSGENNSGHSKKGEIVTPGPGTYQPNDSVVRIKAREVGIYQLGNLNSRFDYLNRSSSPAPGQYSVSDFNRYKSPTAVIKLDYNQKKLNQGSESPAPGQYNPKHNFVKSKSPSAMVTPFREYQNRNDNPALG